MTNRARITAPIAIDMFDSIQPDILVTFTDENAPDGYYRVIPDNDRNKVALVPSASFSNHATYFVQASIF